MNMFKNFFELNKSKYTYIADNICPNCNSKGFKTTLAKNSYACKNVGHGGLLNSFNILTRIFILFRKHSTSK